MANFGMPPIIIIDDDDSQLERMNHLFRNEFRCYTANTGEAGLRTVDQFSNDRPLVICDVKLPDIIGFDVCRTIKSRYPDICVILLTAFNDKSLRIEGLNAYADNYLDKATSDQEIQLTIRNVYNTFNPRQLIPPPSSSTANTDRFIELEEQVRNRMLEYFRIPTKDRIQDNITVTGMARYFKATTRTFQRKMEKHTGSSYRNFLAETKLQRSRELLASNFSITEIAEILDYSSPSHFSRDFKRNFGITPNKYKKEINSLLS